MKLCSGNLEEAIIIILKAAARQQYARTWKMGGERGEEKRA